MNDQKKKGEFRQTQMLSNQDDLQEYYEQS
jgi:hypothetical protein